MAATIEEVQTDSSHRLLKGEAEVASKTDSKSLKKKKKKPQLIINLTNCKYDSVRRVAKRFGMKVCNDEDADWTVYWTDTALPEKLCEMKLYQKVNHFPGMNEICRKDLLGRNMNRMHKLFPKEYNCFPRTWTFPADFGDFQTYCQNKKNRVYISKPGSGCQGKGIFLFKSLKDVKPTEHQVCQQYITKPLLIDGFKFDLRIYILVTSCDPLKVYLYHDGLTRLGTVKYKEPTGSNMDEFCMHLTNYAINKHSKDFVRDEELGSKRRITTINKWFVDNGYNLQKIWDDIDDVIIKTLIAAHPIVKHSYRSSFPNHVRGSACFEILGFDILLDRKLKAWLIEVNRSPSFHTDAPLDKEIKEGLLTDTFNLINLFANDRKRCMEEEKRRVRERLMYKQRSKDTDLQVDDVRAQYEASFEDYERTHIGKYRRIYPVNGNEEKYAKFFDQDMTLCAGTASSRARADLARQLREDLEIKQKEMDRLLKRSVPVTKATADHGESPPQNRRPFKKRTTSLPSGMGMVNRRSISFRLSDPPTEPNEEDTTMPSYDGSRSDSPVCPQNINDEEELQRLASLQVRETIIRGMGMSEQLRTMLESQPSSRIQTPLPLNRIRAGEGVRTTKASRDHMEEEGNTIYAHTTFPSYPSRYSLEVGSQPSLHAAPPISGYLPNTSFSAYSSPSHRMGGANVPHLQASYRLQRQKGHPTSGAGHMRHALDHMGMGLQQSGRGHLPLPHHQAPPPLELCGYSIPPLPHKSLSSSRTNKETSRHYRNGRGVAMDDHRLGIQGYSIGSGRSNKQLKYLSSLPQKTS